MKPSEAQVLGSTLSNLFSQKPKDSNARYTRLRTTEEFEEPTSVHISEKRGPSCCKKILVFFIAFLLLSALTGSVLYTIGSGTYTVQVQIAAGNTMTYQFDHKMMITTRTVNTHGMSGRISFSVANKTDTECWLHMDFSPAQEEHVLPSYLFALRVQLKDKYNDDSIDQNFELFGEAIVDNDLSYHIHCLLRQVLPVVKVKLYKAFLSRVRNSYKQVIEASSPFLPGRVKLQQSLSSTDRLVTITNRAGSSDFINFAKKKRAKSQANEIVWKFGFSETTVLSKETGMAVNSDLHISASVPLVDKSVQHVSHSDATEMKVSFHSTVKLLQEQDRLQMGQTRFEHAEWILLPLPKTLGHPQISYFAPQNKQQMTLQELLNNSARFISEGPKSKFGKFPGIVALRHSGVDFEGEDFYDGDEEDPDDDEDDNDDWQTLSPPPPPLPDLASFGYEDRRKRSLRKLRSTDALVRKSMARSEKISRTNLDAVWDELSAATLSPYPKRTLQVLRTSLFGMAVFGEVEYQVKVERDDEDDDEDDDEVDEEDDNEGEYSSQWSIMLSFYLDIGPYRFTAFKKAHKLNSIKRALLRKDRRYSSNVKHWKEKAGDLVVCGSLFYLQKICVEMRLAFVLTINYTATKFSMAYPVELTVHIEHTALMDSGMSAHVSTWFHEGGLYSTGVLARAKLPLWVSYREDARPEWCTKSNIETKLIQLSDVAFAEWNCSLSYDGLSRTCKGKNHTDKHSFKELVYKSPFWQNWHFLNSCEEEE